MTPLKRMYSEICTTENSAAYAESQKEKENTKETVVKVSLPGLFVTDEVQAESVKILLNPEDRTEKIIADFSSDEELDDIIANFNFSSDDELLRQNKRTTPDKLRKSKKPKATKEKTEETEDTVKREATDKIVVKVKSLGTFEAEKKTVINSKSAAFLKRREDNKNTSETVVKCSLAGLFVKKDDRAEERVNLIRIELEKFIGNISENVYKASLLLNMFLIDRLENEWEKCLPNLKSQTFYYQLINFGTGACRNSVDGLNDVWEKYFVENQYPKIEKLKRNGASMSYAAITFKTSFLNSLWCPFFNRQKYLIKMWLIDKELDKNLF